MSERIAACMILGDKYTKEELAKTIESLKHGGVDKLFVAYNGFGPTHWLKFTCEVNELPLEIQNFEWEDNFALARQQSFDMVPKDEFDWMLWIDSDDFLVTENGIEPILIGLPEEISGVFLRYDYAVEPNTGKVVVEQWRERILRTSVQWTWTHPIHEVCLGPPGVEFARREGVYIQHQRSSGDERGARERNRRIIDKAIQEHPDVPRYRFYFAGETMAAADLEPDENIKRRLAATAIEAFELFKDMIPEVNDDYFIAQVRIAECYRMMKDWIAAFEADLDTIAVYPSWPDGYVGAAKTCMELGDWGRMFTFADLATKMSKPVTAASIESMNSDFTPMFLRAIANENLGHFEEAIADYETALDFWTPPGYKIQNKIEELKDILILGVQPIEADEDRKRLKGTKKDKSIVFITTPLPEDWHPELMKQSGSGGAELCVMKVSKMFAADGWRTVVFGTPGQYRGLYEEDNVEYWSSEDFDINEKFSVAIASRTGVPFNAGVEAKAKIVWFHDVNIGPDFAKMSHIPDKIVTLTPWHKRHLEKLYHLDPDRLTIVPNGVDLDRFPKNGSERETIGSKFIWSSSYDRGLDVVLGLWPEIVRRVPDATLDIFYGWNIFDKSIEQWEHINPLQAASLREFKSKITSQLQHLEDSGFTGIIDHGRVNQNDLANYMLSSDIWPYTTQFMETFCITAIEMQAAGVIPIASKLAALENNVAAQELLIEGWPQNVTYQRRFLELLEAVYYSPPEYLFQARQEGRRLAESMSWENSYRVWNDLLLSMGVN